MVKVSIIVPVYNVEVYLRTCMESILRQTLHDIEIICVNDGSTDRSLEILEEYRKADPRVKVISRENGGYGKAMNIGLDAATGEYVGIVEPDDYVSLTMYEDLYQIAHQNDLDIVKADFYRFETDEEAEKRIFTYVHLSREKEDYGHVFAPIQNKKSFFFVMNTWAGIYRTSFLREHGIRHHETPGASFQDNGFWFQTFVRARRVMIVDRPCYRVRRDNPNSSVHDKGKVYAVNAEYDYIKGLLMKEPEVWEEVKGIYWRKRYHNYCATLNRIDKTLTGDYVQQMIREMQWGEKRGEFSSADFPENEWPRISMLLQGNGAGFIQDFFPQNLNAELELNLLRNSRSYRIGRIVTCIPRKLRDLVKGREGAQP